jgi:hypothetical protein
MAILTTVNVTAESPATLLFAAQGGSTSPIQVINQDLINTVYLGNTSNLTVGQPGVIPLGPGASTSFDGSTAIYGITSGPTIAVSIVPGGSAYSPGIIPPTTLATGSGTISAGNPISVLQMAPVQLYTSYDLNMHVYANTPGGSLAPLTAQVQLQWFDNPLLPPIFEEDWDIWVARAPTGNAGNTVCGNGPMHGSYMSINVFLPPTVSSAATLQYMNVYGSQRTVPYSDWRQNAAAANPNNMGLLIIPNGNLSFDNTLGAVASFNIPENGSYWMPCGLYSGPAYFRFQSSAAPTSAILVNAQYLNSGQIIPGNNCPGIIKTIGAGVTEVSGILNLPRGPTALVVSATAVAADVISFELIAQQAA